jgi:hypothetical protein
MKKRELSVGELSAAFAEAAVAGAKKALSNTSGVMRNCEGFSDKRFVLIPDGTSPAAKFAKEHYGAGGAETPHYAASIPVTGSGKVGNELYAEAFASVLRSWGIEAKATDWADTDD